MKLQCQVEVVNRLLNNLNIKSGGRYLKSTLALAREPKSKGDKPEYVILLFSSINKTGTKYRVKCMKQVFCKCINKGLSTLRFEDPPVDLCIKSEVTQLKCFLKLLKSCITGDVKDLKLSDISNISVTATDNIPTKLCIRDRSQFPDKGLPRTLESLQIIGLKLHNFRRDILLLRNLVVLDLSDNEIEKIPAEFGRMPNLAELILANNQLGNKPDIDWRWLFGPQITNKLKLLDLRGNKLKELPKSIWKLQKLVTLNVDNNMLSKLPSTLGRISTLRYLTLSQNELESLPCSLMHCRLEHIDICNNKFQLKKGKTECQMNSPWDMYVGSLVHLASKVVLKHKLFYAPNIIPRTLVEFLDNANMCVCGNPVVNHIFCLMEFDLKTYFNVVVFDNYRNSSVEFECYFCSPVCLSI
ncbi:leucine-rich repeat protein 1 [Ostrinia nubilalis]|uniref:leucine-rich repeat protein 1 n=1 Tax=Ostrinia nubilalis TaxID=29057 RepID=UPI0030823D89